MNILICGNYGATNIGDELILKGLLRCIFDKDHIVTVLSNNPLETSKRYNVKSVYFLPTGFRSFLYAICTFSLFKSLYAYIKTDEFIFGGGGLMQDEKPRAIFIWSVHIALALLLRKKIKILGNSVGPLNKKWSRGLVRFLFNKAEELTVRDAISKKLLKDIDVKKEIAVVEDFALKLEIQSPKPPLSRGLYIILSLRDWLTGKEKQKFESELISLINYLTQEKHYEIIAIPFEKLRDDDERYLNYIQGKVLNKKMFHVQKYSSNVNKIFELYQGAKCVIGMRLHSIILAEKFKKPFIALTYSDKVKDFCESIGKEKRCFDIKKINFDAIYDVPESLFAQQLL